MTVPALPIMSTQSSAAAPEPAAGKAPDTTSLPACDSHAPAACADEVAL